MEEYVKLARELAEKVLAGELRSDGTPFLGHPDGVVAIVRDELGLPDSCQAAVYLHEASRRHPEIDLRMFPEEIRKMSDGLNKISTIKPKDTRLEAENYKRLIVQYSTDPRVTVLKIADRLEIMRQLEHFPKSSKEQKLMETLMLYIPLAHQLGLYNIKSEMENIYFKYSDPEQFRAITNRLKAGEKDREKLMAEFIEPLKKKLTDEGIRYKLKIRTKSAWSIYKKMQAQKVTFDGVYDVFAIRFIIDCDADHKTEKDLCWKVFSYVTEEYESDTNRLRDWVSNPKPNGYESLHITVKNRQGSSLEVQIRTRRMDDEAENGTAAHWAYKGIRHEEQLDRWLNSVKETLSSTVQPKPGDLPLPPSKDIFVFTPSGELKILSNGASVLDFAFNIHTNIGCKCVGGKINGKAVPIKEKLKTGDVVEILTSKNQRPGKDWINWVISSKARTKIKQELEADDRKKAEIGRELLERRLKNWRLEFPDDMMREMMKSLKISTNIAFLAAIADEEIDINDVKTFIQKAEEAKKPQEEAPEAAKVWQASSVNTDHILVINAKNVKGLEYKMAKCCNPVPGDDVFGFVTRTEGIKIHRMSCPNAARLMDQYPYRIQKVIWNTGADSDSFQCNLSISAEMDHSVLSAVMDTIGKFKASIRSFNVNENQKQGTYEISVRISVPSHLELDKIISLISGLKHVMKVKRL